MSFLVIIHGTRVKSLKGASFSITLEYFPVLFVPHFNPMDLIHVNIHVVVRRLIDTTDFTLDTDFALFLLIVHVLEHYNRLSGLEITASFLAQVNLASTGSILENSMSI